MTPLKFFWPDCSVLATSLLVSPIYDFQGISRFEPRGLILIENILQLKKIFLFQNCNLLIPRPPLSMPGYRKQPSKRKTSSTSKHEISLLFWWVSFARLDPGPEPATQINADPCESGSETLV